MSSGPGVYFIENWAAQNGITRSTSRLKVLLIRTKQMNAFANEAQETFVRRLAAYASEHFPEQCAALGKDGAEDAARRAVTNANSYGITSQVDICKYLNLSLALGPDFDQQEWAVSILQSGMVSPLKMEMLYAAAMQASGEETVPVSREES
jgi:hypothetical protein